MKRPVLISLIIILALTSCTTGRREAEITRLLAAADTAQESFENTRQAYSLYPDDERVLYNYAYMLGAMSMEEEAVRVCDEALALYPRALRFYYLKAGMLKEMGRHQSWIRVLESVLDFDRANTDVMLELAQYYESHFKPEKAAEYAQDILAYNPTHTRALQILARSNAFFASFTRVPDETVYESDWKKDIKLQTADISSVIRTLEERARTPERKRLFQPLLYPAAELPPAGPGLQEADLDGIIRLLSSSALNTD